MSDVLIIALGFILCLLSMCMRSTAHNVTINQATGDAVTGKQVIYEPPNLWTTAPFSDGVENYTVARDPTSQTSDQPITSNPPTITFQFNGTAVYIFGTIEEFSGASYGFILDDAFSQWYNWTPIDTGSTVGNQTLYANASLGSTPASENVLHNLTIQDWSGNMQFHYALYTVSDASVISSSSLPLSSSAFSLSSSTSQTPQSTSSTSQTPTGSGPPISITSHHSDTGAIVGGTIGGVVALLIILATLRVVLLRKRRQRAEATVYQDNLSHSVQPFIADDKAHSFSPERLYSDSQPGSADAYPRGGGSVKALRERLQQMQNRLDSQHSSQSQARSQLEVEATALRAYVARLEMQQITHWSPDDPPPSYS